MKSLFKDIKEVKLFKDKQIGSFFKDTIKEVIIFYDCTQLSCLHSQ